MNEHNFSDPHTGRPTARVTVAGFEPFAGRRRNRSWEVVRRIPPRPGLERVELPVDFARLPEAVESLLARRPEAILLLGESSAKRVHVEEVALNIRDSEIPDNAGVRPRREPVIVGAPLALRATWDARDVTARLIEMGVSASPSFHAATFACNAALYLALHASSMAGDPIRVGFLHVPRRRGLRGPSMRRLARAVDTALAALLLATPGSPPST